MGREADDPGAGLEGSPGGLVALALAGDAQDQGAVALDRLVSVGEALLETAFDAGEDELDLADLGRHELAQPAAVGEPAAGDDAHAVADRLDVREDVGAEE